ncbi:hypothetical protein HaLaN_31068, partial [Haematococcus lacustris]
MAGPSTAANEMMDANRWIPNTGLQASTGDAAEVAKEPATEEEPEAELPVLDENEAWDAWSMGTYTTDMEAEEGVEEHNDHHSQQQQPMEEDEASNPEMIHAIVP